ncbi:MAG: HDOD domain-containing protein [Verrucomicrobia bacterium]|nr:HDOD domain-containing protein [Verrucomicrobiota bacterium]
MYLINPDELIDRAESLQPIPASTARLISLINKGDCDVDEIANVIALDQALTLRLLRDANSAFSASYLTISTVGEAVSRLGTARVVSLALSSHAKPLLHQRLPEYDLAEGQLWRHSVLASLAADAAVRFCRTEIPPASSTAALLHDIGKLVMAQFLKPQILELLQRAKTEGGLSPLEAEATLLQVNHAELGGLIGRRWKLPDNIVLGIMHHHAPAEGADVICDVVYLANLAAKKIEAGLSGKQLDFKVDAGVAQRLGTDIRQFPDLCNQGAQMFQKVAALYGVK